MRSNKDVENDLCFFSNKAMCLSLLLCKAAGIFCNMLLLLHAYQHLEKKQMSIIIGVHKVTKLNLPVSVVEISVGHSNSLVRVKIMWTQHPKSSPKSSWRLSSNTNLSPKKALKVEYIHGYQPPPMCHFHHGITVRNRELGQKAHQYLQ